LLIKSCWLFGAFVGDADVGRLRQATFWTGLLLRTAFWVWERERFPFQAHCEENWGCWILSPSAPTSVEQAGLRSETRDPSLSKPLHSSAIQGENFFFLVNFAVLPQGPGRSKNFVHVASKQVFIGSICTCCCWCKSPIDLPAASKFSLFMKSWMKSWTDQNCQSKSGCCCCCYSQENLVEITAVEVGNQSIPAGLNASFDTLVYYTYFPPAIYTQFANSVSLLRAAAAALILGSSFSSSSCQTAILQPDPSSRSHAEISAHENSSSLCLS
jgi:hypothetical protein